MGALHRAVVIEFDFDSGWRNNYQTLHRDLRRPVTVPLGNSQ